MLRRAVLLSALLLGCPPSDDDDSVVGDDDDATEAPVCGEAVELTERRVLTEFGVVEGVEGAGITAWLGVPFAAAPTGDLRFRGPEDPGCTELFVADSWGNECPQLRDDEVVGGEDCLNLNLWAPNDADGLPVLVFIHGGGNVQGSNSIELDGSGRLYDGALLAERQDVVVVTINYRLGALGWLVHPSLRAETKSGAAGNYGLLDQIAALQWVQDEIAGFGGDPDRVAIFGESGGAVDVCALLTSPLPRGLFHGAIMQSGGCGAETLDEAEAAHEAVLDALGCADADCLRTADVDDLTVVSDPINNAGLADSPMGPVVDGFVLEDGPFTVLANGEQQDVPLIIGANANETSLWVPLQMTEQQLGQAINQSFGAIWSQPLRNVYSSDNFGTPRAAWTQLTTDAQFVCPTRYIARLASTTTPVFRYFFARGPDGDFGDFHGAWHGLDLVYLFQHMDGLEASGTYPAAAADRTVESAMGATWAAFADTADPGDGSGHSWPAYDVQTDPTFVFGDSIGVVEGVRTLRCDLWDQIYASF